MSRSHAVRRALVTGASGGLGRAIAAELAKGGGRIVLFARSEAGLDETARIVAAAGGVPRAVPGDVTSAADRARALAEAHRAFGGLDLLVNNAGVSAQGRFHEADPQRLRRILEVNFFAAAELIRESTPLLHDGVRPAVGNVGSVFAWRGAPHSAEYCASKFALRGLSESIRPELARLGIHVLHASPGTIDTQFFDHLVENRGAPPWGRLRGAPPAAIARRIVRGLDRRRNEVACGWGPWGMVWAARFAPWALDAIFRRWG